MRNVYLIAYDICDSKRYRQIYKVMCGHGDPVQFSVFRCELSDIELQKLKDALWPMLNLAEDRVMIVGLGPINGRGDNRIDYWGVPLVPVTPRTATIV